MPSYLIALVVGALESRYDVALGARRSAAAGPADVRFFQADRAPVQSLVRGGVRGASGV